MSNPTLQEILQNSAKKQDPDRIYDRRAIKDYVLIRSKQLELTVPEDYEEQIEEALQELLDQGAITRVGEGDDIGYKIRQKDEPEVINLSLEDVLEAATEEQIAQAVEETAEKLGRTPDLEKLTEIINKKEK